jgi:hypothetical protein
VEGLTETECIVLGVQFAQATTDAIVKLDPAPVDVEPEPSDVTMEAPPVVIPETISGDEPWAGLPEVGLNQSGERSPNWEDPMSLADLQAATNATYALAIARLAEATNAIEHAGALHARTKLKIRSMLRAGAPVTFIDDLPPSIGRRVDADPTGVLGQALRRTSAAMNSW